MYVATAISHYFDAVLEYSCSAVSRAPNIERGAK